MLRAAPYCKVLILRRRLIENLGLENHLHSVTKLQTSKKGEGKQGKTALYNLSFKRPPYITFSFQSIILSFEIFVSLTINS